MVTQQSRTELDTNVINRAQLGHHFDATADASIVMAVVQRCPANQITHRCHDQHVHQLMRIKQIIEKPRFSGLHGQITLRDPQRVQDSAYRREDLQNHYSQSRRSVTCRSGEDHSQCKYLSLACEPLPKPPGA